MAAQSMLGISEQVVTKGIVHHLFVLAVIHVPVLISLFIIVIISAIAVFSLDFKLVLPQPMDFSFFQFTPSSWQGLVGMNLVGSCWLVLNHCNC